jgi:hypothetical protein
MGFRLAADQCVIGTMLRGKRGFMREAPLERAAAPRREVILGGASPHVVAMPSINDLLDPPLEDLLTDMMWAFFTLVSRKRRHIIGTQMHNLGLAGNVAKVYPPPRGEGRRRTGGIEWAHPKGADGGHRGLGWSGG